MSVVDVVEWFVKQIDYEDDIFALSTKICLEKVVREWSNIDVHSGVADG